MVKLPVLQKLLNREKTEDVKSKKEKRVIISTGYYSGKSRSVIYFVVNRFQIAKLKMIVSAIDPSAFITISETSDVLGSSLKGKN